MQDFYVYILLCNDGSFYVGHTDDLEKRLSAHEQRYFPFCYTASRLPVSLLFTQEFGTRDEALAMERMLKRWTRRKKQTLIDGDVQLLKQFSKRIRPPRNNI